MAYWAAVRVRLHRERLAERCLGLLGFTVYSPRLRTYRIRRDRRQPIVVSLFPGYIFIEIVLQWRPAYQSLGVCGIVKGGQAPAVVPNAVIDDIRRRERDGVIELRRLRVGARVRILSGPFRNHLGLCRDDRARARAGAAQRARGATPTPAAHDAVDGRRWLARQSVRRRHRRQRN